MPELPDIVVYLEALDAAHPRPAARARAHPEPVPAAHRGAADQRGRRQAVSALRRIGKRIVIGLEGELFLVLHLMIAGRLRWLGPKDKPPGRITLALLEFSDGTLAFTEAGTKRRASLHLVQGEAALAQFDSGGLEVLDADLASFRAAPQAENHTLKRALTDPHIFSGIGNAYSDEILHRARLSPVALTAQLDDEQVARLYRGDARRIAAEWTERLRAEAGQNSRRRSPRSAKAWRCTAASANPARCAARRCNASSTPRTRPTTARAARPAASSSPTARCRGCCRRAGRGISTSWTRRISTRWICSPRLDYGVAQRRYCWTLSSERQQL